MSSWKWNRIPRDSDVVQKLRYKGSFDVKAYEHCLDVVVGLVRLCGKSETTQVSSIYVPFRAERERTTMARDNAFFYGIGKVSYVARIIEEGRLDRFLRNGLFGIHQENFCVYLLSEVNRCKTA